MIRATFDTTPFSNQMQDFPQALAAALSDMAKTMKLMAEGRTPVKTGLLKRSWSGIDYEATGFSFGNNVSYAEVLENGWYRRVGPRTVATGGGIFSRQAPGGMLNPLLSDDNLAPVMRLFLQKLEEVMGQNARA